jgi:hypothetical protein
MLWEIRPAHPGFKNVRVRCLGRVARRHDRKTKAFTEYPCRCKIRRNSMVRFRCRTCSQQGTFVYQAGAVVQHATSVPRYSPCSGQIE